MNTLLIRLSDCLVSYPGRSLGVSYSSAEVQSVYSTAPVNWGTVILKEINVSFIPVSSSSSSSRHADKIDFSLSLFLSLSLSLSISLCVCVCVCVCECVRKKLISLEIFPLGSNTIIPPSWPSGGTWLKPVKQHLCICFNVLRLLKSLPWDEF